MKSALYLFTSLLILCTARPAAAGRCSNALYHWLGSLAQDIAQTYTSPEMLKNLPALDWKKRYLGYQASPPSRHGTVTILLNEVNLTVLIEPGEIHPPLTPLIERLHERVPEVQSYEHHEFNVALMISSSRKTGAYTIILYSRKTPEFLPKVRTVLETVLSE